MMINTEMDLTWVPHFWVLCSSWTLTSFQVMHDNYLLYVFAPDCESRQRWVLTLKEGN